MGVDGDGLCYFHALIIAHYLLKIKRVGGLILGVMAFHRLPGADAADFHFLALKVERHPEVMAFVERSWAEKAFADLDRRWGCPNPLVQENSREGIPLVVWARAMGVSARYAASKECRTRYRYQIERFLGMRFIVKFAGRIRTGG